MIFLDPQKFLRTIHFTCIIVFIFLSFYGCTSTTTSPIQQVDSAKEQLPIKSSVEVDFIFVKGGCFEMGCDPITGGCPKDSQPKHRVCVDAFWMGRHEVTNEQFEFFKSNKLIDNDFEQGVVELEDEGITTNRSLRIRNKSERKKLLSNHPVTNVSWYAAKMMAGWLSENSGFIVRLPTEAEWEFACCSGENNFQYGTKNGKLLTNTVANYEYENGFYHSVKSVPVAKYPPNNLGLHDLSGNVSEWCEDWYNKNYYSELIDKSPLQIEKTDHKVVRGGSYDSIIEGLRCSTRNRQWPDLKTFDVGFRLVIEPSIEKGFKELSNPSFLKLVILKDGRTRKEFE